MIDKRRYRSPMRTRGEEMSAHGIIFNTEMVRAILGGCKTQTRRVIHCPPFDSTDEGVKQEVRLGNVKCPHGEAGDLLWVRETWQALRFSFDPESGVCDDYRACDPERVLDYQIEQEGILNRPLYAFVYAADGGWGDCREDRGFAWRSPVHMPRWASRIWLRIVSVRHERLQDISEADAKAEGVKAQSVALSPGIESYVATFAELWDSIYGPDAWDANPWVWRIEFERVDARASTTNKGMKQ